MINYQTGVYKKKAKRCIIKSIFRFSHFLYVLILVILASSVAAFSYLLEKAWVRGRAKKDDFCILKIIKSFIAFWILLLIAILMLLVPCLSFISNKISRCHQNARREKRKIKAFLSNNFILIFSPFVNLLSGVYNISWRILDRFDDK